MVNTPFTYDVIERRRDWIAGLRTAPIRQAHRQLRSAIDPNAFCCLGFRCNQIDPSLWSLDQDEQYQWNNVTALMPLDVAEAHGLTVYYPDYAASYTFWAWADVGPYDVGYHPTVKLGSEQQIFSVMNDDGWTFDMIADALEVHLP